MTGRIWTSPISLIFVSTAIPDGRPQRDSSLRENPRRIFSQIVQAPAGDVEFQLRTVTQRLLIQQYKSPVWGTLGLEDFGTYRTSLALPDFHWIKVSESPMKTRAFRRNFSGSATVD